MTVQRYWGVDVTRADGSWATSEDNPVDNRTHDFGHVVRACDYDALAAELKAAQQDAEDKASMARIAIINQETFEKQLEKVQAELKAMTEEQYALRSAIRKRINTWCKECRNGKPVARNSLSFFSHREDGNHCNSDVFHQILADCEPKAKGPISPQEDGP